MKLKTRIILFFLLIAFLLINAYAQDDKSIDEKKAQDEKFIAELIQSLGETNPLRLHLQRGYRGDGIHQDWMDEMKKFGIKQVSFYMNFEWKDYKVKSIAIKEVSYYPEYYPYDDVEIKDPILLQKIKDSGLEKKLEAAALVLAEKKLLNIMKSEKRRSACGVLPQDLLDDERLPFISIGVGEFDKHECPKN